MLRRFSWAHHPSRRIHHPAARWLFSTRFQVNIHLPIHPSLRRAYDALEPLFLEHIITEEVGGRAGEGTYEDKCERSYNFHRHY